MNDDDRVILDMVKDKNHIVIANKCDLIKSRNSDALYLSTVSKEGLDELKEKIFTGEIEDAKTVASLMAYAVKYEA